MARAPDPLAAWKARMQPTDQAKATYRAIGKIVAPLAGDVLAGQVQQFPPKYVLACRPASRDGGGRRS